MIIKLNYYGNIISLSNSCICPNCSKVDRKASDIWTVTRPDKEYPLTNPRHPP